MFKDKYKKEMNEVHPTDDAITRTRQAIQRESVKPKNRAINTLRAVTAACLVICLMGTVIFTAYKINYALNDYTPPTLSSDKNQVILNPYAPVKFDGLRTAKNYDEISDVLNNANVYDVLEDYIAGEEGVPNEPSFNSGANTDIPEDDDSPEYTDTNNQVAGVQEGDIVKTDGKYIYFYSESHHKVFINEVNDGNIKQVATIDIASNYAFLEMFIVTNKLIFVCQDYNLSCVYAIYYDISDKKSPVNSDVSKQDGEYLSGRAQDGFVYIISSMRAYRDYDCIPTVNGDRLEADRILIPDECQSKCFTVITSYDVVNNKHMSNLSILGASDNLYVSKNNIYLTSVVFENADNIPDGTVYFMNTTKIYRIALNNGIPVATGAGNVCGSINNQFWMDEKDGMLRVAAIINPTIVGDFVGFSEAEQSFNKVYCLGENLELIGESEKLGIDETIKSVRYIGDIAYVVTFRQTDPLYAIDLSEPTSPKTLSELKIDGFSTYMHPYGANHLLGLGYNATSLGATNGLKMTMFDISDDTNIYDVCTYTLPWKNQYLDSEALSNHKAVLVDYNKALFGIPLNVEKYVLIEEDVYKPFVTSEYVFFAFDGTQIVEQARVTLDSNDDYFKWEWSKMRGLVIGDYAYVVGNSGIVSIALDNFEVETRVFFE